MVLRLETVVYPPANLSLNNHVAYQIGTLVSPTGGINSNGLNVSQASMVATAAQPAGLLFCFDDPENVTLGDFVGRIKAKWISMRPNSK